MNNPLPTLQTNTMFRQPKLLLLSLLLISVLAPAILQAASVSSISREQYRQDSPEEIFWEVSVTCAGISEKRIIEQRADTQEWCSRDVKGYCSNNKMVAAKRVCGAAFNREFSALQAAAKLATEPKNEAPAEPIIVPRVSITPPSTPRISAANEPAMNSQEVIEPIGQPNEKGESKPVTRPQPVSSPSSERPNSNDSERVRVLKSEIDIETQRISIEQQKLDLRRRELELKKRELGLLAPSGTD